MQFYHDLIIEKSFQFLQELKKSYAFILIGGWAVFFHTNALKSKDIDIIVDYDTLGKLKERFAMHKNERLKKYEIKPGEFDVDIYVPHYSDLGIPAEEVQKRTISKEGFILPEMEILFLMKLYAWHSRRGSIKGQKDELDIFSLSFAPGFRWDLCARYVAEFNFEKYQSDFAVLLQGTRSVPELNVNEQKMSKIRRKVLQKL